MEEIYEVVIVGAGIAGVATALALKKVGIQSVVLERFCESDEMTRENLRPIYLIILV